MRNAIVKSVHNAKGRSATAVKKLEESKSRLHVKAKEAAKLLLGDENYKAKADGAIARFKVFDTLDKDPVGADSESELYRDSEAWKALESKDNHYRNFVFYCHPDLKKFNDDYGNTHLRDNARYVVVSKDGPFATMEREPKENKWGEKSLAAKTSVDEPFNLVRGMPEGMTREKVPETITFHPLHLKELAEKNYETMKDRIPKAAARDALKEFNDVGASPMDYLTASTFDVTVHHEMFHLTAFGGMRDIPMNSELAYGWKNNRDRKDTQNVDLLAILAVLMELVDKGYKIEGNGKVTKR